MGFSLKWIEEIGEWESKLQCGIKENHYRDMDKMLWKQNKKMERLTLPERAWNDSTIQISRRDLWRRLLPCERWRQWRDKEEGEGVCNVPGFSNALQRGRVCSLAQNGELALFKLIQFAYLSWWRLSCWNLNLWTSNAKRERTGQKQPNQKPQVSLSVLLAVLPREAGDHIPRMWDMASYHWRRKCSRRE